MSLSLVISVLGSSLSAQTVAIQNGSGEHGFGWMFARSGSCYVIMPRHVAGTLPRVTVTSAAPVANGTATVIIPFWEGMDLAIGVVRGGIEARCTEALETLNPRRDTTSEVLLHRLTPTGEEVRLPLSVLRRSYLTIEAEVPGAEAAIYQGTSGAFAFAGTTPIGMAIESEDTTRVTLMRTEEILANVTRYLAEQSVAFVATTQPQQEVMADSIPLQLVSVSVPPISPQYAPENILGEGHYVFEPQRQMELLFRVVGNSAAPLSRLRIESDPGAGFALPKRILIFTDASTSGNRYREWGRGEIAIDGTFDSGLKAGRNFVLLRVLVLDYWSSGPASISRIIAN